MIHALDLPLNEVTYTFVDGETGEPTHIAVSALKAAIKRAGVVPELVMMGEGLIEAMARGDLNVEEDHALKLPDFPAYLIPEKAWRHFEIEGLPGDGKFWEHVNRTSKVR